MSLVENRYAEALVNLALEKDKVAVFRKELALVLDIFQQQSELRSLMLDMGVDTGVKKQVVSSVFDKNISLELRNFLKLLLDKGRTAYLPGIVKEFERLADMKQSVLNIKIYSAFPLDNPQVERIKEKYREIFNARSAKAEVEIDKGLIGGVKVEIGDRVIDASVSGMLQALKEAILSS